MRLTFVLRHRKAPFPSRRRSNFVITTDNWDDYGYKVQFHMLYFDENGTETRIGTLKILQAKGAESGNMAVKETTTLPEEFTELSDAFISIGQDDAYYHNLHRVFGPNAGDTLSAVRDIAWQPTIATPFEPTPAFRNALMRENGAHRARRFGRSWALGESAQEDVAFLYSCEIPGADAPINVSISFDSRDLLPGRIVGVIGRNATGKTRFLATLAEDLTQVSRSSAERLAKREFRFPGGRPLFTRILALSYSAFDRFKRPPAHPSSSYIYCGIRTDKGQLSQVGLANAYRDNQKRIRQLGRENEWSRHMQTILAGQEVSTVSSLKSEMSSPDTTDEDLAVLSSGQAILCHFVTGLLAWIQPSSLVLFDEPETHLHPNAVANLFVVLAEILASYDCYAIVATHSPVVIQEIPAKRVIVFRRVGNLTTADTLTIESFGESVTELTRHVFETIEVDNLYKHTLKRLARQETAERALARFPLGLGLSAQAFLLAQYPATSQV